MAEHIIQTDPPKNGVIFQLRYDTYSNWMNSRRILKKGEAAIAVFPNSRVIEGASNSKPENTPPAVGMKIGDGESYFYQLPWVQAIAADVYNWAKDSQPPAANTIPGLNEYIATYLTENGIGGGSSGGSGSSISRQYQLIRGTDDNSNKYYLRYKNDDSDTWVTDTAHYIDVDSYEKVVNWIGTDINSYPNLRTRTGMQMLAILEEVAYTDTPATNYFVTSVNQANGIISVNRAQPTFSNLTGYATVKQGGTGHTTLPAGEVLVGNGENAITTVQIAEEIANNTQLVPNYLVKAYVDEKTTGITGAMHYIGEATVEITGAVDPKVDDYNFSQARKGDVITQNLKEYVWTGYNWRLIGDEGSYAIKGSIKNADIDIDAAIQPIKIDGLMDLLAQKVSIVEGKDLSSNDYTDEDKLKLANIQEGAQKNIIEHFFVNSVEIFPTILNNIPNSINLIMNVFTDTEKLKLSRIDDEAQVNLIESISLNGTAQPIDTNKNVNLIISEFTQEAQNKLETIDEYAKPNTIETIYLNNTQLIPNAEKRIDINILIPTQAQLTKLDALPADANANIIESISLNGTEQAIIDKNVNLLINEFSTADKQKLDSINAAAEPNVIETIYLNNTQLIPTNKRIDIDILTITQQQLDKLNVLNVNAEENVINTIQLNGTTQTVTNKTVNLLIRELSVADKEKLDALNVNAQENIIESISLNNVPQTIINKNVNLTINEFTTAYQNKLDNIESYAQVNTIETIYVNNRRYRPNNDKEINITINQDTLNLDVITGAIVPDVYNNPEEVTITEAKKLSLARIAKTGNVMDLKQTTDTYIIINCGTSTTVL